MSTRALILVAHGSTDPDWRRPLERLVELLASAEAGAGVCVGAPVPDIDVRIIRIDDGPIDRWSDDLRMPDGEIGEIAVRGPMVTEAYFNDEPNTARAKIRDGEQIWHRMGDVGWRDDRGRIWFCGRKAHRVIVGDQTMFTDSTEKVFDAHPLVYRSALVGPAAGPTLCVELEPGTVKSWSAIEAELRALAAEHPGLDRIRHYLRYDKRGGFPVDIRHNAKIGREQLREWAEGQLR